MSEHTPKKTKKPGSRKTAGKEPLHIVLVEDEKAHAELIRRGLLSFESPYRLTVAATLEEARVVLAKDPPDFVILDQLLPDGKGEDLLPENPEDLYYPVIVMTCHGDETLSEYLMQRGVADYFTKSGQVFDDLPHVIERTIRNWKIREEHRRVERELTSNASLLKTLINNPVDSIALLDKKGTILDLNTTFAGIMGTTVTNAIGTCAYKQIPEPLAHARRKMIDTVFKTGVTARFEDERNERWYDNIVQPVRDSTGRVTRVIVNARDITREKESELALRASKEKYRFLIEDVEEIIWETAPDLRFTYLSPATEKLTGYSIADLIGTSLLSILTGASASNVEERLSNRREESDVGKKELPTVFEVEMLKKDGGIIWLEVSSNPVISANGLLLGFHGICRDITKSRASEEELKNSELRYRTLYQNSGTGIITIDKNGVYQLVNKRAAEKMGAEPDDIIGKTLFDFLPPDVAQHYLEKNREMIASGTGREYEETYELKTGSRTFLIIDQVIKNSKGEGIALQSSSIEITDRKRVDEALRESEERYRTLIDELPDYVLVHRQGELLYVNASGAKTLGYLPEDLLHTNILRYIAPDYREIIRESLKKRTEGASLSPYEVKIITHDGSVRCVEIRGSLITFEGQNASLNVLTDITEKKSAEKALADSELKFRTLADFTYDWEYWVRPDGGFIYISPSCEQISGYTQEEFYRDKTLLSRIVHPDDQGIFTKHLEAFETSPEKEAVEFRIITKMGDLRWINHKCQRISGHEGENLGRRVSNQDITLRKRSELITTLSNRIYKSANRVDSLKEMLKSCVGEFREFSGCEAVGIRLLDAEGNIPYQAYCGFPEHFYETETPLSIKSDECMCIYAIKGMINPDLPVSTPKGSFYCNATSRFLASVPEEEKGRTRNVCNQMGYESVALIPIRTAAGILGLVQFNDPRENMVPFEMVSIVEEVALPLGETIRMMQAEQALRESEEKFRILFNRMIEGNALHEMVYDSDGNSIDYRILDVNRSFERILGIIREEVIGKTSREAYRVDTPPFLDIYARVADSSEPEVFESYFKPMEKHFAISVYSPGKGKFATIFQDISERRKMENALRENEEKFRALVDGAAIGVGYWTPEGVLLYLNEISLKRLKGKEEDFIGKNMRDLLGESGSGMYLDRILKAAGSPSPMEYEDYVTLPSGSGWYLSVFTPITNPDGTVRGIQVLSLDVTERKLMEEKLLESETRYRRLYETAQEGIWGVDADFRVRYANPRMANLLGYSVDEIVGCLVEDFIAPGEKSEAELRPEHQKSGQNDQFERRFVRRDRKIVTVLVSATPIISHNGSSNGYFAMFTDITERKLAEEALLENKVRLETAMEIANLANWEFDVKTSTFIFNDRFFDLYGTTAEREGGYHMAADVYIKEFVHPDDLKSVNRVFGDAASGIFPNYSAQLEHRIVRRDGHVRYIIVSSSVIRDASGKDIRVYGANQDITDRKMMEDEVRSLNRVLEQRVTERTDQLNASLDEKVLLLREIHHRVKNNLQIVASLFNLQSRYIVDQSALEAIRESQNRVRAMALVHERIYRSENVGSIDLKEYLTFLGEQVFRYYGVKSSQITLSLSISALRLDIDTAIPLGLVINEMLSNSLKHGFPDGRKGTISIACCECDKEISLVFSDDGVGLPEGLNWKNPPSLGLRLIISLVRQLKGKVELDPSPGTTFRITAPLVHPTKHEETGSMLN